MTSSPELGGLLREVAACRACADHLPLGPRPILQIGSGARLLIASQAPGRIAHGSGIPFADRTGDALRLWLGIERSVFYDAERVAILPLGLCYPGRGAGGDLPPRPECRANWHPRLLPLLPDIGLTLAIGQYAQAWFLGERRRKTLTDTVAAWREYAPDRVFPLPHPSPRNTAWFVHNPWFEAEVLPALRARVAELSP
jgi:uracil-DNA glycosylase